MDGALPQPSGYKTCPRADPPPQTAHGSGEEAVAQGPTMRRSGGVSKRRRDTADAQYVARSRQEQKITLKRGIEVGPRTTERIVRARYEWRDAGLAAVGTVEIRSYVP